MTEEAPRALATAKGLAALVGRTPAHVRNLMKYKGAPDPVPVVGGHEAVYDAERALAHLRRVMASE